MNVYEGMSLGELEGLRDLMLVRLGQVPAFRKGTVQHVRCRCGKASCHCARDGDSGHERWQWVRSAREGTRGHKVAQVQVPQIEAQLGAGAQFAAIVADLVEVNEAICEKQLVKVPRVQVLPAAKGQVRASGVSQGVKKGL